jgi:hypothetical protein
MTGLKRLKKVASGSLPDGPTLSVEGQKTLLLNKFSYFICYCCRLLFSVNHPAKMFFPGVSPCRASHRFPFRDGQLAAYTGELSRFFRFLQPENTSKQRRKYNG